MSIWKTIAGAAAMAAVVVMAPPARAAQPGVLVPGDDLPPISTRTRSSTCR